MILYPKQNRQYIFVKGNQLQIEDILDFIITKILSIKGIDFFIFQDKSGVNYLVPKKLYDDYNYSVGMPVKGWVDKINCMGRIFIEPCHPFYLVGKTYDFELLNYSFPNVKTGQIYSIITVRDLMGKIWYLTTSQCFETTASSIKCKVEKIKKGQLFLQIA